MVKSALQTPKWKYTVKSEYVNLELREDDLGKDVCAGAVIIQMVSEFERDHQSTEQREK